jgi:hypothetical protein
MYRRGSQAAANIVMHATFYVTHAVGRRWIAARQRGNVVSMLNAEKSWKNGQLMSGKSSATPLKVMVFAK